MSGALGECARTLVQAVFRLAFCDYIGIAYGYDEPYPDKYTRIDPQLQADAATFLTSWWAAHLGELAGLTAKAVWTRAQRDLTHRPVLIQQAKAAAPKQWVAPTPIEAHLEVDVEVAA